MFGSISRIYIAYDRDTGESRGFAFVNFVHRWVPGPCSVSMVFRRRHPILCMRCRLVTQARCIARCSLVLLLRLSFDSCCTLCFETC